MTEFDRQVENLMRVGYHKAAGLSADAFKRLFVPLRKAATGGKVDLEKGTLPFVIVVQRSLVSAQKQMSLVKREGKSGVTKLFPKKPVDFSSIEKLPKRSVYVLQGIDRGKGSINIAPDTALKSIRKKKRLPLTVEEGIALVTHYPGFLKKNNCYSLLASRIKGDKRVPAIWINAKKQPNLGWCWAGNPHTWLGSASAKKRI